MNNWSSWANLVNNKNSFSLNILENEIDPVAGSFSNILPSRKWFFIVILISILFDIDNSQYLIITTALLEPNIKITTISG